jgi:hypothetical protein
MVDQGIAPNYILILPKVREQQRLDPRGLDGLAGDRVENLARIVAVHRSDIPVEVAAAITIEGNSPHKNSATLVDVEIRKHAAPLQDEAKPTGPGWLGRVELD